MAFQNIMAEATRLTQAGSLIEATALIQSALGGGGKAVPPTRQQPTDVIIDLVPNRVIHAAKRPTGKRVKKERDTSVGTNERACFEKRTYHGAEGSTSYMLYRPANATADMPLVIMLHGCTQTPEDFARGTGMNALADELGFLIAYPRQSQSANMQRCWNWFKPGDQQRDRGEPALLAGITREVIEEHQVDADRVYVAGLSAGGAAAAIMADCYPDLYAAVGIHSGLACGAARDLPSAMAAMKRGSGIKAASRPTSRLVPVITFHGDHDTTVNQTNSSEIVAAATAAAGEPLAVRIETGRSATGRAFTRELSFDDEGKVLIEQWTVANSGHAWSGGSPAGSYTDPSGPDASREMMRFFFSQRRG